MKVGDESGIKEIQYQQSRGIYMVGRVSTLHDLNSIYHLFDFMKK